MNTQHVNALKQINPNLEIVKRFAGGMSNFTYLVIDSVTGEKFVFRYPGNGASNFVNYHDEFEGLNEAFNLGLTSETVYFDTNTGIKLAKYVEGDNLVDKEHDYSLIINYFKSFHSSKFKSLKNYNHLKRLDDYEKLHSFNNQQYQELKNFFLELFNQTLKQYVNKPCHNDSQLANFIYTEDKKLFLVDFEYVAINDPIYDYACFGNKDLDDAISLMSYADFDEREKPLVRLYGWRMFQCLQWYNVAAYKHEIGLGEQLGIDFLAVSNKYITLANTLKSLIESIENN